MAGSPVEARHPIKGLMTGDAIAYTVITGYVLADPANRSLIADRAHDVWRGARGTSDVLVLAFPAERRQEIMMALEKSVVQGRAT